MAEAITWSAGGAGGGGGTSNTCTVLGANNVTVNFGENELFSHHAPKAKGVKAVKVTYGNLNNLVKFFNGKAKKVSIETGDLQSTFSGGLTAGQKELTVEFNAGYSLVIKPDDWVIEEFDYEANVSTYRLATLKERQKHDLR